MRFDLTDLRLFLNVHEAGTITGGAEGTHMTLASASERIHRLEDSLGVPLLLRDRRGVRTTPAGRTLLHHARLVLRQLDRLQGELADDATPAPLMPVSGKERPHSARRSAPAMRFSSKPSVRAA